MSAKFCLVQRSALAVALCASTTLACPEPAQQVAPTALPSGVIGFCGTPPVPLAPHTHHSPPTHPAPPPPECPPPLAADAPIIQVAILLDTSGSMEGLINQARSRIWDVVNDLSRAHRHGKRARLEVALYQYGSGDLPSSEGFLTLALPFTTDLDMLSERLFSLRVGGSAEYCGWALQSAMGELSWDGTSISRPLNEQPLRVIVIAGNEPFTQGPVSFHTPVATACSRGVIVNTVYCGPHDEGHGSGWSTAARMGGGAFLTIDQNVPVVHVPCPMDGEILGLNERLNRTYFAYGPSGGAFKQRQIAQDGANRALSEEGAVKRAQAKSSAAYDNSHWDIVDAVKSGRIDLATAPTESLPADMRPMTVDERRAEVRRLEAERQSLRERIRTLAAERERWLREQNRGRRADTLDAAMIRAIREQARRLGFGFEAD